MGVETLIQQQLGSSIPRFNSGWQPSSGLDYVNGIDQPSYDGTDGIEYRPAFSGIDGLSAARRNTGDGTYTLYRTISPEEQWKANATIGPDGNVSVGDWAYDKVTPLKQQLAEFAALAAAAYGGLNAVGAFGGGAGAGAGAGAAGSVSTATADPLASYFGGLGGAEGSLVGSGFTGAIPNASLLPAGIGEAAAAAGFDPIAAYYGGLGGAEGSLVGSGFTGATPGASLLPAGVGSAASGGGGVLNSLSSLLPSSAGDWAKLGLNAGNAFLQNRAIGKAADSQLQGLRESNALLQHMYDTTRADNLPALEARNYGLSGYRGLLQDPYSVRSQPGYQFGLDEGSKRIERSAAAAGGLYSGRTMKALQRYGQDYADSKFDNSLNRFGGLAGLGQVGAGTIANAGMNYGNQRSGNALSMGDVGAASAFSRANTWGNALNQFSAYGDRQGWWGSKPPSGPSNAELEQQYGFSDARLKTNLRLIGKTARGFNLYAFDWIDGGSAVGVIAQEVAAVDPGAVRERDGFLQVNYSKV